MRVIGTSRDNRRRACLRPSHFFQLARCRFLCLLGRGARSRAGCRGQRGLGCITVCSRHSVGRGAGTDNRHKLDKLRSSFSGYEVHLKATICLSQPGLVVELGLERAILPTKNQGRSDEDKDTESQPENHSRRLLAVDPESVAPAAARLDQLRTIASLSLPKSMRSVG